LPLLYVVPSFDGDPEALAADQLRHAQEQLVIQSTYPGRHPARHNE
jgi:hypothetical protein